MAWKKLGSGKVQFGTGLQTEHAVTPTQQTVPVNPTKRYSDVYSFMKLPVLAAMFIISLVLFISTIAYMQYSHNNREGIIKNGVTIDANVIDFRTRYRTDRVQNYKHYLTVEYSYENETYEEEFQVATNKPDYQDGDHVEISILPSDPSNPVLANPEDETTFIIDYPLWGLAVLFGLSAFLICPFFLILGQCKAKRKLY